MGPFNAICIVEDTPESEHNYMSLINSAGVSMNRFPINRFYMTTRNTYANELDIFALDFDWPEDEKEPDIDLGIVKMPLNQDYTRMKYRAMTHYRLWDYAIETQQTVLILEDSVRFTKKLDLDFSKTSWQVVSINNPKHCVDRWDHYTREVMKSKADISPIPYYMESYNLLTLPDAVSYFVTPEGATQLILNVDEYGLWPVEKMLSKQLYDKMAVSKKFYTKKVIL